MSLNQVVQDNYKFWLDPYVNSIKIDGTLTYKENTKASGDNLVLDDDLVAQWTPINSALTPYGNAIAVKISASVLTSFNDLKRLAYVYPYAALYSFNDGDNFITFNQTGVYMAYVNVAMEVNLDNSLKVKLQLAPALTYTDIIGSEVKSFPGSVIFNSRAPFFQETCVCSTALVNVTVAGSRIGVVATCSTSSIIDAKFSSLTLVKLT